MAFVLNNIGQGLSITISDKCLKPNRLLKLN